MSTAPAPAANPDGNRRPAWREPLLWILLAGAAVRIAFFLQVRDEPTFTSPLWDSVVFREMARNLAAGHGSGLDKAYFFGPLYGYWLGLVFLVTGGSAGGAAILQHGMGLLLGGLTYKLARRWFGRAESATAAALLLFSGVQVYFEGKLLMEVLVSTLLVGSLLLLTAPDARSRLWRLAGAGLLLGLAATGRPSLLLLAPLALVSPPMFPHRGAPPSRRRRLALLVVFGAGVVTAPLVTLVRNLAVEGVPVLITASGGYNLYVGNGHDAAGRAALISDGTWNAEDTAEAALGRDLDSAEVSRYWRDRAFEGMVAHPLGALGSFLKKGWLYLGGFDVPQIEWYGYERARWSVLGRATIDQHLPAAAALGGLAILWPRRRELAVLFGAVLGIAVGVALFFVLTRYRVVYLPLAAILGAAFLTAAARAVRERNRRVVGALLLIAIATGVATAPSWQPVDGRRMLLSQYLHEGLQLTRVGLHQEAVAVLLRAREVDPDDWEPHLSLGVAYRERGDLESSLASLQAALARNAADPEIPYQCGVTLHALGRVAESESALRRSLQINPRRAATLTYLGLVQAAQGRFAEAQAAMELGLELDAAQPQAWNNLGALRARMGDLAGARDAFERALGVDVAFSPARLNLARWHLDAADPAAARRELRQVLAADPTNAEAAALLREVEAGGR